MNRHENNKFGMYESVLAVCGQHRQTIESMPPLVEALSGFEALIPEIRLRDNEYLGVTAGATMAKNGAFEILTDCAERVSDALFVYGRKSGNEQLKAECGISRSALQGMRENKLLQFCARLLEFAKTNATDIAPYGISAEDIEFLGKSMEQCSLRLDELRHKSAESKAAREVLTETFQKTDEILKEDIDIMVGLLRTKDIDFYNKYQAARTIKDYGQSRSTAVDSENSSLPSEAMEPVNEEVPA